MGFCAAAHHSLCPPLPRQLTSYIFSEVLSKLVTDHASLMKQEYVVIIFDDSHRYLSPVFGHKNGPSPYKEEIIAVDETTAPVLRETGKAPESKSYMWVYRSGRYGPGIVLYEYKPSRAREHPEGFLKGFSGFLQSDGYQAYQGLSGVTNVGCWAHARRGFDEAIKAAGGKGKKPKALEGLHLCNQLYEIERECRDLEPKERYNKRFQQSKPVLQVFLAWLQTTWDVCVQTLHLGQAINYCLNNWEQLNAFLLDGRLEIDNNRTERSIRPFVISRKNFLFCNTPGGAKASAVTFSLIESAKESNLRKTKVSTLDAYAPGVFL
jgi:transposase